MSNFKDVDEIETQEKAADNDSLKAFDAVKKRLEEHERDLAEGDGEVVECRAECADLFVTKAYPELAALTALEQEPLFQKAIEITTQRDPQKFLSLAGNNSAVRERIRGVILAARQIQSLQSSNKAAIIHLRSKIDDISAETEKPSMGGHRLSVQIKYKLNGACRNADLVRNYMNGMAASLARIDDLLTRDGKETLRSAEANCTAKPSTIA
jgi:hypothetical protein